MRQATLGQVFGGLLIVLVLYGVYHMMVYGTLPFQNVRVVTEPVKVGEEQEKAALDKAAELLRRAGVKVEMAGESAGDALRRGAEKVESLKPREATASEIAAAEALLRKNQWVVEKPREIRVPVPVPVVSPVTAAQLETAARKHDVSLVYTGDFLAQKIASGGLGHPAPVPPGAAD